MKRSILIKLFLILLFNKIAYFSYSQTTDDDLFLELDKMSEVDRLEVIATFKSTRVMFAPSTERVKENQLQFRISHLFNNISTGLNNLFGLDDVSNMQISFDYGLNDKVQLGFARSNKPDKTLQFSTKWSPIRQSTGKKAIPVSVSFYGGIDIKTTPYFPDERNAYFLGRLDFVNMILISRKINKKLSLQLSPSYLHRNLVETNASPNDLLSIGIGGRYMLNAHVSVNGEYFHTVKTKRFKPTSSTNSMNVGIDVETGGHVFQLYLSNSIALHPSKFLTNENKDFLKGQIQFGFSLMRVFNLN